MATENLGAGTAETEEERAGEDLHGDEPPSSAAADAVPWHEERLGRATVGAYVLLALLGVVATTAPVATSVFGLAEGVAVPVYIYFYSLLGSLAYVFTHVLAEFDRPTEEVIEAGLRIPAALMLGGGVFLLGSAVGWTTPIVGDGGASASVAAPSVAAVFAFLAGLYVRLTLRAFGKIAEGIYDGIERSSGKRNGGDTTEGENAG